MSDACDMPEALVQLENRSHVLVGELEVKREVLRLALGIGTLGHDCQPTLHLPLNAHLRHAPMDRPSETPERIHNHTYKSINPPPN